MWLHNDALYCGKLLYFEKGKRCSLHYHKLKTETFYLESGTMEVCFLTQEEVVPGKPASEYTTVTMHAGDVKEVPPGLVHQMRAVGGPARLFEFSSQHWDADSYRVEKGD